MTTFSNLLTVGDGDTHGVPVTVPGQLVVGAQGDDAATRRTCSINHHVLVKLFFLTDLNSKWLKSNFNFVAINYCSCKGKAVAAT